MNREHCTAHIVVIRTRRTLKKIKAPPQPPAPNELEALELARTWAIFFHTSTDKSKLWESERERQCHTATQAPVPKPDTSKWDSLSELARA